MAAVVSRRNVFIRLFGLLVVASLFTSYLIYLQVNADDQIVRIIRRERSRKDSNIAIISKLYTPVRRSVMISGNQGDTKLLWNRRAHPEARFYVKIQAEKTEENTHLIGNIQRKLAMWELVRTSRNQGCQC
ncbi:hypothetical protein OS493_031339 [Desmophyllum pertusum]|uniref:Uncharacterized protein n=1 Tax=Desmophyllum pertusum TaxID=174260 RepID=A0A9X0CQK8_9CNID|nr:hypothetical protein OS493_031339 [Desmophyllum pertusum]